MAKDTKGLEEFGTELLGKCGRVLGEDDKPPITCDLGFGHENAHQHGNRKSKGVFCQWLDEDQLERKKHEQGWYGQP